MWSSVVQNRRQYDRRYGHLLSQWILSNFYQRKGGNLTGHKSVTDLKSVETVKIYLFISSNTNPSLVSLAVIRI